MAVELEAERRDRLLGQFQVFFRDEFDESLSAFKAEKLLDFLLTSIGPQVYNQAIQDARKFMLEKLEDLDGEVHEPEL